jgi:RNA polymerase sigma factor (sigma-70 family)
MTQNVGQWSGHMATGQLDRLVDQIRKATVDLADSQLLKSFVAHRSETAFEALVRRHGPMVLGVCRRVVGDPHDADDAFQATFLVLARKAKSLRSSELLGNWLYGVAYRTALKARVTTARQRAREKQVRDMPNAPAQAEPETIWNELAPLLDRELSRLAEKYRVPVVLCELEGKSRKEAARQLGIPEGTLSSRLAMARRLLAKRLSRHGLAVSGLAATFSTPGASACMTRALVGSTVEAALLVAAGKTPAAVTAVALADAVLRSMLVSKLKLGASGLLAAALLCLGTLGFMGKASIEAGPLQAVPPTEKKSVPPPQEAWKPPPLPPDVPRWGPLGRPIWLLVPNPVVQAEMKLDTVQKKALAALVAEVLEPLRKWREFDPDERKQKYKQADELTKKGLAKILSDRQRQRLREIDLQQKLPRILGDKDVAAKLKPTEQQQWTFTSLENLFMGEEVFQFGYVNEVYRNPKYKEEMSAERHKLIQDIVKRHADAYERLEAALSNEQRMQLREILGKKIDIAALIDGIE